MPVTHEVAGSIPAVIANDQFIVSFGANVVLTVETKTGMSSEADLNVNQMGRWQSWSIAPDCKSGDFGLRRFESYPAHQLTSSGVQVLRPQT